MEHEHKWFSLGRLSVTITLLVLLFIVITVNIVMFISGPAIRYDDKIAAQRETILREYEDIEELHRHVFAYIIYCGQDESAYYWFNEQGDLLTWRSLRDIDMEKARAAGKENYQITEGNVSLGYGYRNPVYIIEDQNMVVYLDIDTMEQVFLRRKG